MLHNTKADGPPLELREPFLECKSGQPKPPPSLAPTVQPANPQTPPTSMLLAQLLSALGQAYLPSLLSTYPVPGYSPMHMLPPPSSHPLCGQSLAWVHAAVLWLWLGACAELP